MEQHIIPFNNKNGVGYKEESFIELGHQIGIKENCQYQGVTIFQKKIEASLKAQTIPTHPLIVEQTQKVLQETKRAHPDRVTKNKERGEMQEKKGRRKGPGVSIMLVCT
jgi:hypothetical protein